MDVFLVAGQSNSVGQGDYTLSPKVPDGQVFQYYNGVISTGTDPLGNANTGSAWPSLGLEYNRISGKKICFVPSAVDGSSVVYANNTTANWDVDGTLFGIGVANVTAAMNALTNAGHNPVFKGVLWVLGETDASNPTNHRTCLQACIARFRQIYGATMPFYISTVGFTGGTDSTAFQTVRGDQEYIAANDPYTHIMFRDAWSFPARGFMNSDNVHYNQTALNQLGIIAARNILGAARPSRSMLRFHSSGSISANASTYLGSDYFGGVESLMATPLPYYGTIMNLYSKTSTAPTSGQSAVYTIEKNGSDTGITCTTSGTNISSNDVSHNSNFNAGDTITVKLVTSITAATAWHGVSCEIRPIEQV